MSVFKGFPGLENLETLFQDFQGPARALGKKGATVTNRLCSMCYVQHIPDILAPFIMPVTLLNSTEKTAAKLITRPVR